MGITRTRILERIEELRHAAEQALAWYNNPDVVLRMTAEEFLQIYDLLKSEKKLDA